MFKIFTINNSENIYNRKNMNGHITVNGFVIKKGKILMIRHPFLAMDLLPGGHIEKNENPIEAAIREVQEETGYNVKVNNLYYVMNSPIHIETHAIPQNEIKKEGAHVHYNLSYILDCNTEIKQIKNELQYYWLDIKEISSPLINVILNKIKEVNFNEWISKK